MAANAEVKQHAHQLLDQLGPSQLEVVAHLLEVMVRSDQNDEDLTAEDRLAVTESRRYFREHPQGGIPFEQLVSECGFDIDQIRNYNEE